MHRRQAWVLILAVAGTPAYGHHSLYGVYARSQEAAMQGVVAEFRFVNPHPILVIEVRAGDGTHAQWELEMDNRAELARIGLTSDSFAAGDYVFVKGSLGLVRPRSFYLWRLDRPADGFWYEQRGSMPYTGFAER
jgi:hypothetical protein